VIQKRGSGVLLHISSLPSCFGIGDMGEDACRFVDFLSAAGQRFWQILPLNVTAPSYDNSPYMSLSAFAGNSLFISLDCLFKEGLLKRSDLKDPPRVSPECVNYSKVIKYKEKNFTIAWQHFKQRTLHTAVYDKWDAFCRDNRDWLDDYALFMALRTRYRGSTWSGWPKGMRDRHTSDLRMARNRLSEEVGKEKFLQFLFFTQWDALKEYCNDRGILIIGDMPIYVGHESADVWSHPELFQLDKGKAPAFVSGVPPDYFSKTGQRWGHPLYRWDVLKKSDYDWMIRRIAHNVRLFDSVRIDHFRGFVNYWKIPATEKTAIQGRWVSAPAFDFFDHLTAIVPHMPFICEDLGSSPPEFRDVMAHYNFTGTRVLLFAFDKDLSKNPHAPHNHTANSVIYTGTHDNSTIKGWFMNEAALQDRRRFTQYIGKKVFLKAVHWDVIRLAMMSVANIAVVPLQDILGLGDEARMNLPGTTTGNWAWRFRRDQLTPTLAHRLLKLTSLYGRSGS
jgi:4-alpha-glucanotransferase